MRFLTDMTGGFRLQITLKKFFAVIALAMVCFGACAAPQNSALKLDKLPPWAELKGNVLTISSPDSKTTRWLEVPVEMPTTLREPLVLSVECWASELGVPSWKYGGMKFMLPHRVDSGVLDHPGAPMPTVPFPRRRVAFAVGTRTSRIESPKLVLGLQSVKGVVHYDVSTFKVEKASEFFSPGENPLYYKCKYTSRVKDMPQLRGVMLPPPRQIKPEDLDELVKWGVTLVRYQMVDHLNRETFLNAELYSKWMDENMDILEKLLVWAKKNNVKVCVDMHFVPGGRTPGSLDFRMFAEKYYADCFIAVWKRIAARLKGRPEIYGYDLCNEPWQTGVARHRTYWQIQKDAAEAIREVDPETPIIIEADMTSSPPAFAYLVPLRMTNIIYQVHMYEPIDFTHLNASPFRKDVKPTSMHYPDKSEPKNRLTKDDMTKMLKTVRNFEKRYGARIYVGEFSASMWASGAENYIADCIDHFEKYGWDWTYHAFREWEGWSVEHEWDYGKQAFVPSMDNPRKQVLMDGLSKSVKKQK
ncbi:MAG: cellulase family glycosylhydrolase [Victivallaceae bacterium]|nr:cellulase family glycosylhydrolase [Victivallaceae bacterium]